MDSGPLAGPLVENIAKRGYIARNPVALAKPPRVDELEVDLFEAEEIERILAAARRKRNGIRFIMALALGLRQGEALGLKWSRLREPTETLEIMKGLQRQIWQHGCTDPHACGARYHKTKPCPKGCGRHKRPCPPPCPPDCTSHARWCPERRGGGLVEVEVKSRAGRRGIVLPDQLFALITEHRKQRTSNASTLAPSGMRAAGCSPSRPASRLTRAAISMSGRLCWRRPGSVRHGSMTPVTPQPRPYCSSASRNGS
jgi:hypothetical protein